MKIAVAIPCYKVKKHVLNVISRIPAIVDRIYAVDDACPESSGQWIEEHGNDPRLVVLYNDENQGVGGAVLRAYKEALADGMDIIVKVDGDGQMAPELIPLFVKPIMNSQCDYTKGNRFFRLESLESMPRVRLLGNAALSFITKASCGYWNIMDPTNGYTAIHSAILRELPLEKISKRYFFETDMLFRLNTVRAVVRDVPMDSLYEDEKSNLHIKTVLPEFIKNNIKRLVKRYGYSYWLRDFNIASIYSVLGVLLLCISAIFGGYHWLIGNLNNELNSSGTVMLAALPVIIGFQFLIAFLQFDMANVPSEPLAPQLDSEMEEKN